MERLVHRLYQGLSKNHQVRLFGPSGCEEFVDAVRAFDRVLISGAYAVPLYHVSDDWVAHWPKVSPP